MKTVIILTVSTVIGLGMILAQYTFSYPPEVGIVGKAKEGMKGNYLERVVWLKVVD